MKLQLKFFKIVIIIEMWLRKDLEVPDSHHRAILELLDAYFSPSSSNSSSTSLQAHSLPESSSFTLYTSWGKHVPIHMSLAFTCVVKGCLVETSLTFYSRNFFSSVRSKLTQARQAGGTGELMFPEVILNQ